MKKETDVLVVGNGAAGLRAACAAAEQGLRVLVVSKGSCASVEIMGFNAVAEQGDTTDCFYEDLVEAGCELSKKELSRTLAEGSVKEIDFLEKLGFVFDCKEDGSYHVLHTLGCRYPRLVHQQAVTGIKAMSVMRQYCKDHGVEFESPVSITDVVLADGKVVGAVGLYGAKQEFAEYSCKAVVLATGGAGALRKISTYPGDSAGDGCAIAWRAGAKLVDMEFQQFEPCAFVHPKELWGKIVPTTLLRSGAKLVNGEHQEFMENYGLSRENARKGALSRAMAMEIREGRGTPHGGVYYDMTMMPRETIVKGHSIFYEPAIAAGLDITQEPAEMAPASHTFLGGVQIDSDGATCVPGLFAAGEVTGGVHGADRIGGCAGAETLVFGGQAGRAAGRYARECGVLPEADVTPYRELYQELTNRQGDVNASELTDRLAETMSQNVGILRDEEGLKTALAEVTALKEQWKLAKAEEKLDVLYGCRNLLTVAHMQVQASLLRKESRGVFSRVDYPQRDDINWKKNLVFYRRDEELVWETQEVG